jgi:hypothetical protein
MGSIKEDLKFHLSYSFYHGPGPISTYVGICPAYNLQRLFEAFFVRKNAQSFVGA